MTEGSAPYRGEFRCVFHAPRDLFDATVAFYRDALRFPVVGGFAHGAYLQASVGIIEVITDPPGKNDDGSPVRTIGSSILASHPYGNPRTGPGASATWASKTRAAT